MFFFLLWEYGNLALNSIKFTPEYWKYVIPAAKIDCNAIYLFSFQYPETCCNDLSQKNISTKKFPNSTSYDREQKSNLLILGQFKCPFCLYHQLQ